MRKADVFSIVPMAATVVIAIVLMFTGRPVFGGVLLVLNAATLSLTIANERRAARQRAVDRH